ncbi:MAG: DUF1987 domain-containing protein [Epsilonproteobacteria bacterium]|nr:DUF1987 domain-containing protein [Campylobacterota bacterium]
MDNIFLEQSDNSPKVIMDKDKAFIAFEGKSYPENTFAFYRPITEWLKQYFKYYNSSDKVTVINFKFLYFNSATTQIIFEILDIVEEFNSNNRVEINWFYNEENKNGFEDYEDYAEEFPKLNIKAVVW